jgi:hypothetical protein
MSKLYYDPSQNILFDLSKNQIEKINNNRNKLFHDALNGIFLDYEKNKLNCRNKKYMLRVVEIFNYYTNLIKQFPCINYLNKHIMYMYIMDRNFDNNEIIIKIGYTYHLYKRNKSLCNDFNCELYLIGIKEINSEDEIKFHEYMKQMKKEYIFDYQKTINKKKINKYELYLLHDEVINEFNNYNVQLHNNLLIEQEKTKQIEAQEKTKQDQEKTKQIEVQEKTKQMEIELEIKKLELQIKQKKIE